jgi:uncharacterized caspase-like protein
MLLRFLLLFVALVWMATAAEARRVALLIGQNAYCELVPLDNPVPDPLRMAELLGKHGLEVIACDGKTPGCFDLDRSSLLDALQRLEERATGADLAFVFFAGHGMATGEVNILGPVDAGVDCSTSGVPNVVPV